MELIPIKPQRGTAKRCVISLGVGRKSYIDCLKRLEQSLRKVGFHGDLLIWSDELPAGSPSQLEAPMAFKGFCFNEAKLRGYEEILWIDAPIIALRPLEPLFSLMNQHGFITFANNHDQVLGQWCGDAVLAHHQLNREEAMAIPETPTSVIGFDLKTEIGNQFLNQWHTLLIDGITCKGTRETIDTIEDYYAITWNKDKRVSEDPRVRGHRHDQTAAGIISHRLNLKPYADSLRDIHYKEAPINRHTILLHHREFGENITSLNEIYHRVFIKTPLIDRPRSYLRKLTTIARGMVKQSQRIINFK
jgi:hypothetical protein